MPLESDQNAEREERIERILQELKKVQQRVSTLESEAKQRSAEIDRDFYRPLQGPQ